MAKIPTHMQVRLFIEGHWAKLGYEAQPSLAQPVLPLVVKSLIAASEERERGSWDLSFNN